MNLGAGFLLRLSGAAAVLIALAACAPVRTRGTAAQISAQQSRETLLAPRTSWNFDGHFAVSDGHDGGSGTLT